jgi:excisionase family DNA binding protein
VIEYAQTSKDINFMMASKNLSIEVPLEWFTVEEAARYLRVSKRTIYKWSSNGRLPAYLIGDRRHRRYRKDDLDNVPRRAEHQ